MILPLKMIDTINPALWCKYFLVVYKIFADTTSLLNLITFSSPFSKMHSNKLMAFPSTLDMLDQILNIIFATFYTRLG